jgi:hypothetical protein
VLSGLVHQISIRRGETAPTETTAFRSLFEQTGCRCTQYNIRPPSGPRGLRTTDTPSSAVSSFGRYSVLGYSKTPVPPPGYLSNKWISRILHKRNNKPTSAAGVRPLVKKDLTRHKLKYKLALTATIVNDCAGTYSTVGAVETHEQSRSSRRMGRPFTTGLYTTRIRFTGENRVTILHGSPNSHLLLMERQGGLYQTSYIKPAFLVHSDPQVLCMLQT